MKATVLALKISTGLLTTFFFSQFDHFGDRSRCIAFIFPQLMRLKRWADSHPLYTSKETLIKMSQFFFFFNLKLKRVCLSGCYWSPFFLQSFFCIQIKRRLSITFRSCFVFVQLALKKKKRKQCSGMLNEAVITAGFLLGFVLIFEYTWCLLSERGKQALVLADSSFKSMSKFSKIVFLLFLCKNLQFAHKISNFIWH